MCTGMQGVCRMCTGTQDPGPHLLGGAQLALQVFDLLLRLPDASQGVLVSYLLALPAVPLLQLPDATPQLIDLQNQNRDWRVMLLLTMGSAPVSRPWAGPPALTSAFALRSAAMSCTLSRCSLGADLYMSSSSFISF